MAIPTASAPVGTVLYDCKATIQQSGTQKIRVIKVQSGTVVEYTSVFTGNAPVEMPTIRLVSTSQGTKYVFHEETSGRLSLVLNSQAKQYAVLISENTANPDLTSAEVLLCK